MMGRAALDSGPRVVAAWCVVVVVLVCGGLPVLGLRADSKAQASTHVGPDFDGDGYADLVVGAPDKDAGGVADSGQVTVLYGGRRGPKENRAVNFDQDSIGMPGRGEAGDFWGVGIAAGDFDGDGFDDLAVSAPDEDLGGRRDVGTVTVLYGSRQGLSTDGSRLFHQNKKGVPGRNEPFDYWGWSLSAGDFDGDGRDDLAVGAPDENIGRRNSGAVTILYGSRRGLATKGAKVFHQGSPGVPGKNEVEDFWGRALASGDFNGDGRDDLALGTPFENSAGWDNAGSVTVLYGGKNGLSSAGARVFTQDSPGVPGSRFLGVNWGWSLASGDFNDDGHDDLAVGGPIDWLDFGPVGTGSVTVLSGSRTGLTGSGSVRLHQDSPSMAQVGEEEDFWGYALAAGDMDGDGYEDLVVGAAEDFADENAGTVTAVYGSARGLIGAGSRVFHQGTPKIPDRNQANDHWGIELDIGDFNGDTYNDVVVGAPYESFRGAPVSGAVTYLRGSRSGLTNAGARQYHQDLPGIPGQAEPGDFWGFSLPNGLSTTELGCSSSFHCGLR